MRPRLSEVSGYADGIVDSGFTLAVIAHLAIARFSCGQKHPDICTLGYGAGHAGIDGAAWPLTILVDGVQRK